LGGCVGPLCGGSVRTGGDLQQVAFERGDDGVPRELAGGEAPAGDPHAHHELPDLVVAALFTLGSAVAVITLIDAVKFQKFVIILRKLFRRLIRQRFTDKPLAAIAVGGVREKST